LARGIGQAEIMTQMSVTCIISLTLYHTRVLTFDLEGVMLLLAELVFDNYYDVILAVK